MSYPNAFNDPTKELISIQIKVITVIQKALLTVCSINVLGGCQVH